MFKNINTKSKYNQAMRANLVTLLPIAPNPIGRRPRIYQKVANIKLHLDVHIGQDVYIYNLP